MLSLTPDMCIGKRNEVFKEASQALRALVLLITISVAACSLPQSEGAAPLPADTYTVDPLFREYYKDLGGIEILGPAISTRFDQDTMQCQYTLNVMMCQDPQATGAGRFQLYPLGKKIGIHDNPESTEEIPGRRIVDGYIIYPGFVALYDALRGSQNSGRPLTGAMYNYELQRVEQYFENLGFYYLFDDPEDIARLLPYGAAFCDRDCRFESDIITQLKPGRRIRIPFADALQSLGGDAIFGQPLTDPYPAPDGRIEQVYQNAVLYAQSENLQEVYLRPLPKLLGMAATPPGVRLYDRDRNVVFYTVTGELGYHVPVLFDQYISSHGGMQVAGTPIAETIMYEKNIPRQCFEYYCLDLYPKAAPDFQVRPTPLGIRYLQMTDPVQNVAPQVPENGIVVNISEAASQIPNEQPQMIEIQVLAKATQLPASDLVAELKLITPDGSVYNYDFPTTSQEGKAWLEIPPMPGMPNGSLMAYQVCVNLPQASPVCQNDAYLIWQ